MSHQNFSTCSRLVRLIEQALLIALLSAPMLVGADNASTAGPVPTLASASDNAAVPAKP
jgi:hypothetical protein